MDECERVKVIGTTRAGERNGQERERVRKPVERVACLAAWMDGKSATKDKKE